MKKLILLTALFVGCSRYAGISTEQLVYRHLDMQQSLILLEQSCSNFELQMQLEEECRSIREELSRRGFPDLAITREDIR